MMEGLKSRAAALIVCIILILVGWFGGTALQAMGGGSLTAEASGLRPKAVVMTVDGRDVTAQEYLYWLTSTCDSLYQYYGISDWTVEMAEGMTVGDYVKEQANYYVQQYTAIEHLAAANGITLTEEAQAQLDGMSEYYASYYGGEEFYEYMLRYAGLSEELLAWMSEVSYYYSALYEKLLAEGGELEPTEENVAAWAGRNAITSVAGEELLAYYQDSEYGAIYDYVNDYIDRMEVVTTASYDAVDVAAYYAALQEARAALEPPEAAGAADGGDSAGSAAP